MLLAAELVGSCEQTHQLAVEYAKVRVQFDRPLAAFQAIWEMQYVGESE